MYELFPLDQFGAATSNPVAFPTASTTLKTFLPPLSSFTSKVIETEESSPSSVTHASDPTTSSSDPPYTRDDPADQGDVQIFMFLSVEFIFRACFLLSSGVSNLDVYHTSFKRELPRILNLPREFHYICVFNNYHALRVILQFKYCVSSFVK